jgi:hypothetical protein
MFFEKNQNKKLAIFAGNGILPKLIIENCLKKNRDFLIFQLASQHYQIDYSKFNPIKIYYGELEKFLTILSENKIEEIVFAGGVVKPNFSSLKVDKTAAVLLAKILANKILGDDAVLKTVIKFFEKSGFKILPVDQILDCFVRQKQTLTIKKPTGENLSDISLGIKAIKNFSKFDVGQSVIIAQKQIIAVEALEGTDQMIKRCRDLKTDYTNNAILVKMKKINQSSKADLPTIGVETVENCFNSNISGIAIQSASTIILEKEEVIKSANKLNLFIEVF